MKNTQPIQKNQLGAKDAFGGRPNYTSLQITVKALPWLALQALVGIVLTLSAGGLAL